MYERTDFVQVTNQTGEDIEGRFSGTDYVFPVGETRVLPVIAARHIFGFGDPDKTRAILRLGWGNLATDAKQDGKKIALDRLKKIRFEELPPSVLDFKSAEARRRPQLAHAGTPAGEGSEADGEALPSSSADDLEDGEDFVEQADAS